MESWRNAWRQGVAPLLSVAHLEALRTALVEDDPRLLQKATTKPPPLQCVQDWPVEAACLLGYCAVAELGGFGNDAVGVANPNAATVAEVEEFFARMCHAIDEALGEPAACRWLLNHYDDTPREEMRREYLGEVLRSLAEKLHEQNEVSRCKIS